MAVKQMKQQKFKKGQKVAWGSQAGGIRTTKKGTVVAVVNTPMIDLPKTEKLAILRELHPELSKKELERKAMFVTTEQALSEQYHLKFSPLEAGGIRGRAGPLSGGCGPRAEAQEGAVPSGDQASDSDQVTGRGRVWCAPWFRPWGFVFQGCIVNCG